MLRRRIIPCLDVRRGRLVKGVRFRDLRDCGDPVDAAARYAEAGADEIVWLNISAGEEAWAELLRAVERAARRVDVPLCVGGGVDGFERARDLLLAGADKVSVNTAALDRPELVSELAERLGSQCVVVAIDAARADGSLVPNCRDVLGGCEPSSARTQGGPIVGLLGRPRTQRCDGSQPQPHHSSRTIHSRTSRRAAIGNQRSGWEAHASAGTRPTGRDAIAWSREAVERGAGELLVTSIDADGGHAGYDLDLVAAVAGAVSVPVVASGGAGGPADMAAALAAGAQAALAASIFHDGEATMAAVKEEVAACGLPVRA